MAVVDKGEIDGGVGIETGVISGLSEEEALQLKAVMKRAQVCCF